MEQQIITALTDPNITALLGARVYLQEAPPKEPYPYCRFFEITNTHWFDFEGLTNLSRQRWQFDFYGNDTQKLSDASYQVKLALDRNFDLVGAQTRQQPTGESGIYHYALDVTIIVD